MSDSEDKDKNSFIIKARKVKGNLCYNIQQAVHVEEIQSFESSYLNTLLLYSMQTVPKSIKIPDPSAGIRHCTLYDHVQACLCVCVCLIDTTRLPSTLTVFHYSLQHLEMRAICPVLGVKRHTSLFVLRLDLEKGSHVGVKSTTLPPSPPPLPTHTPRSGPSH